MYAHVRESRTELQACDYESAAYDGTEVRDAQGMASETMAQVAHIGTSRGPSPKFPRHASRSSEPAGCGRLTGTHTGGGLVDHSAETVAAVHGVSIL